MPTVTKRKVYCDTQVVSLAEAFLEDAETGINHKERIEELSALIQTTIDDWMATNEPDLGR